jgi:2-haloacid dehalogenase
MIKTILWDLGGVFVDWNPRYMYRKVFDSEQEMEAFLANIATMEWNEEQDGGRTIAEGCRILIEQYPDHADLITMYYSRWEEMLGGVLQETVDIYKQLKDSNQYKFYALTNWSAETFPRALKLYDFLHWFDGILVSGEEKLKKPDPAIYQLLLDRYTIDPSTAVFIDDNLRNVKAAIACGIPSIHFTSPADLVRELNELGVSCDLR